MIKIANSKHIPKLHHIAPQPSLHPPETKQTKMKINGKEKKGGN